MVLNPKLVAISRMGLPQTVYAQLLTRAHAAKIAGNGYEMPLPGNLELRYRIAIGSIFVGNALEAAF